MTFNFYGSETFNACGFIGIYLIGQIFKTNAFGVRVTHNISDFYVGIKIGLCVNATRNYEV